MNRLEIAVSLLGGGNFALSDTTIREAFKNADRIIAIHEEEMKIRESVEVQQRGAGMFGRDFDNALANLGKIRKGE